MMPLVCLLVGQSTFVVVREPFDFVEMDRMLGCQGTAEEDVFVLLEVMCRNELPHVTLQLISADTVKCIEQCGSVRDN